MTHASRRPWSIAARIAAAPIGEIAVGSIAALIAAASVAASLDLTGTASAQAPAVSSQANDAKAGKALVDRDCVSCHAQQFGGDADEIYKRSNRRVKTPAPLLAQVQACNTNLGKGYFPEEEEHIATYLNLEFYKFKP